MSNKTVENIGFNREWQGPNGIIYYFNIKFTDGKTGSFSTIKKEQTKFEEGKEYDVYVKETDKKGVDKYDITKEEGSNYSNNSGGGAKKAYTPYVEPVEKQAIILAQSQTSNACSLIAAGIVVVKDGEKLSTVVQLLASSLMTITIANAHAFVETLKGYQQPKAE